MHSSTFTTWLADWARIWTLPRLTEKVRIRPGPRLRRSLGRCQPSTGIIRIHPSLLEGRPDPHNGRAALAHEPLLKEVLCHEAAHVAAHLLHGRRVRPHGPEWARLMRAAGYEPRASLNSGSLPASFKKTMQAKFLYHHRCPACGAGRIARRAVHRWRCRDCYEAGREGRLEISKRLAVVNAPELDATR